MVRIQGEGILPSRGLHHSMDENIRPVFTISDHVDTYGLLFFKLNPREHGYNIFKPIISADGEEYLIYTPQLKMPMQLCLKSASYVESKAIRNLIFSSERTELREYRNELEDRLRQRDVDFKIVEPRHMESL